MNDEQENVLVELKKLREDMALPGRNDNYGMIKEFIALQAEVKQMKEDQENQKVEYKKVCEDLEKQKDEVEKLKADQGNQKVETTLLQIAHEKALEDQKTEYKKVCKELNALKRKQSQDVSSIREESFEMKKKQVAQDLKLQNHDDSISVCKKMPVEDQIVGKWKMVSSTGRVEYDKQMLTYDSNNGDRAKITYESRYLAYDLSLTLRSFVDNDVEDVTFKSKYCVRDGRLVYYHKAVHTTSNQLINVFIEKQKLVVVAVLCMESGAACKCKCIYGRVN